MLAGRVGEMEKRICQALCKVKHQEDEAKEVSCEINILLILFFLVVMTGTLFQ